MVCVELTLEPECRARAEQAEYAATHAQQAAADQAASCVLLEDRAAEACSRQRCVPRLICIISSGAA